MEVCEAPATPVIVVARNDADQAATETSDHDSQAYDFDVSLPWSPSQVIRDLRKPVDFRESDVMPWSHEANNSVEDKPLKHADLEPRPPQEGSEQADNALEAMEFDVEPDDWREETAAKESRRTLRRRARSLFLFCIRSLILWGALWWSLCSFFPQQTSWIVSGLSGSAPYTAIPIMEMLKPIGNQPEERGAYLRALQLTLQAAVAELGMRTNNTTEADLRDALIELEKIQNGKVPLSAYVHAGLAIVEANSGRQAEDDLFAAEKRCSELLGSKNFMVALVERKGAAYFSEEKDNPEKLERGRQLARQALAIDLEGADKKVSSLVIEDEQLLVKICAQLKDSNDTDQSLSALQTHSKLLHGGDSVDFGLIVASDAMYKLKAGQFQESLTLANKAMVILQNQSLASFRQLVPRYASTVDKLDQALHDYLKECRKLEVSTPSTKRRSALEEGASHELEDRLLQFDKQIKEPAAQFDQLTSLADEHNISGQFQHAAKLYKQALAVGQRVFGKRRQKNAYLTSDRYLLCMAKTACNDLKVGNTKEAVTIATNCLKMASPYNSWFSPPYVGRFVDTSLPQTDFSSTYRHRKIRNTPKIGLGLTPVFKELIFGFGADRSNSPEVRRICEQLRELLEIDYNSSYLPLLAQLEELQGHDQKAESHYKELAKQSNSPVSSAALAAFYHRKGRNVLAGKLFEQADQMLVEARPAPLKRTISLGKLKYLLDLAADEPLFESYNWITKAKAEIAKVRTSYDMASFLLEIDLDPVYHNCRPTQPKFADREFLYVQDVRNLSDRLPSSEIKKLEAKFDWYRTCFPATSLTTNDREITAKSSMLQKYAPGTTRSTAKFSSPADLIPDHILVISIDDARELQALMSTANQTDEVHRADMTKKRLLQ